MFLKMSLFLIILSSCQTVKSIFNRKVVYETEEFRKYAELFEKYSREVEPESPIIINDLEVKFNKLKEPRVGQCAYMIGVTPRIEIDPDNWAIASAAEKEVIMFHELGHCILNRGHRSDVNAANEPLSIMFSNTSPKWYYEDAKMYYIYELFSIKNDWKALIELRKTEH